MQKRDAETTKAKIVENAMMLFSQNGFDATTVDQIAEISGVNKALIYYYFKNKAGLYETVMSSILTSIQNKVMQTNQQCITPLEELEAFIKSYAEFAYKQPYFPALLMRELSDSGAHLPEMMFANMRKLFKLLSEILKRGEAAGEFKNVVPIIIHFMIIGTINLLVTTAPLRKKAAQIDQEIDTCSQCSAEEISQYMFEKISQMLQPNQGEMK